MERDFRYLRDQHTDAGAREIFEKICSQLLCTLHDDKAHQIRPSQGDGGIDILIGDFTSPIENYQCKYFIDGIDETQKDQIRKSFDRSITSLDYKMKQWTLCVPCELSVKEFSWWSDWKSKMEKLHNLPISLYEGSFLIFKLKQLSLYDTLFDNEIKNQLNEILTHLTFEKLRISEEIIIWMKEIEQLDYDDMIFVKKLENARIAEIEGCKRDFFNAEFVEQTLKSKGDENKLRILDNLKLKIYTFWQTQYRAYQHDVDGNDLLTRVYMRIEDADTTTLQTNLPEISLLAKKGILHQWAEECSIGWLKDYEQKLKEYLLEVRGNNAE